MQLQHWDGVILVVVRVVSYLGSQFVRAEYDCYLLLLLRRLAPIPVNTAGRSTAVSTHVITEREHINMNKTFVKRT